MNRLIANATAAPEIAETASFTAIINLLRFSFVGGGAPVSPAIFPARSLSVPSLTWENSGLTKNITRSKYSQVGLVTSTTWWFTPLIKLSLLSLVFSLLLLSFGMIFMQDKMNKSRPKTTSCNIFHVFCGSVENFNLFTKSVENYVESVDNCLWKRWFYVFFHIFTRGKHGFC